MITTPTFMFYLSDIMQSYPLHTPNVVLFLVSSWKQMSGVRRVVSVADRTSENIDLVGERSNFKKIPTHTQDHGDA